MEAGNRIIEENIIQTDKKNIEMEDLELTKEWDKIFPKSYKVNHSKVTFRNRYGCKRDAVAVAKRHLAVADGVVFGEGLVPFIRQNQFFHV